MVQFYESIKALFSRLSFQLPVLPLNKAKQVAQTGTKSALQTGGACDGRSQSE